MKLLALISGLCSAATVLSVLSAQAVALPSPNAPCSILPSSTDSKKITSFEEIPAQIRAELVSRFEARDTRVGFAGPRIAPRDSDWQEGRDLADSTLARRRFIEAGQHQHRYYVWYQSAENRGGTTHMVIADLNSSTGTARLINHLVGRPRDLDVLCEITSGFMHRPAAPGPGLDDNQLW
jgi:hypothetical protein